MVQLALTQIPFDTDTAARYIYSPNQPYLRLGRQVEELLKGIEWGALCLNQALGLDPWRLVLVTIFQYKEQLADMQAVEAVRVRTDWKYALHLPLVYLGIRPANLCRFRAALMLNQPGQMVLGQVIECMENHGFLARSEGRLTAARLLAVVCTTDRLFHVRLAMSAALEALVVIDHDWLRTILLPHWYIKYDQRSARTAVEQPDQQVSAEGVGRDIRYLLDQVRACRAGLLQQQPAVQDLETVWLQHYQHDGKPDAVCQGWRWREEGCAYCPVDFEHCLQRTT